MNGVGALATAVAGVTVLSIALGACGTSDPDGVAGAGSDRVVVDDESDVTPGEPPTPDAASHACDEWTCSFDEFCVKTQGALCSPLPAEGEACPPGCTLTEHCCNCPAFACLPAPDAHCPDGPSCACLDADFLADCGGDRRECAEADGAVNVLCIAVAYDEDPFAAEP